MPKRTRANPKKRKQSGIKRPTLTRRRVPRRGTMATMGFLRIERKFYDNGIAATNIASPTDASGGEMDPSSGTIGTPAVGDGEQNRDGKQLAWLYLDLNGIINIPSQEDVANPPGAVSVYLAVILDTQTNGAQLNSEDVFKNTAGSALMAACPLKNLLFGPRFRILKAKTFQFNFVQTSVEGDNLHSTTGQQTIFRWYIPLRGLKVNHNAGTTASIANVIDNSLHVIAYSSNSVSQAPTLSYNSRVRFVG